MINIVGPDTLVFAVPDMAAAAKYLTDYGLSPTPGQDGRFEALDGTGIQIVSDEDSAFPNSLGTNNQLRLMVYGVSDRDSLDAIAKELRTDREVVTLDDGAIEAMDDLGFRYRFQLTVRRELTMPGEAMNIPGAPPERPRNAVAIGGSFQPAPRTLSHFSLFVPDLAASEAFHVRLGFYVTDRLGGNPFLRSAATDEHHTLFIIQTPPPLKGAEHLAFHVSGPGEVMQAGSRFVGLGYESVWGPGRHVMGSNWFWYFKSPLGINVEYDADMDKVDDTWLPRELPFHADNAQAFHFEKRDNVLPGGGPGGAH